VGERKGLFGNWLGTKDEGALAVTATHSSLGEAVEHVQPGAPSAQLASSLFTAHAEHATAPSSKRSAATFESTSAPAGEADSPIAAVTKKSKSVPPRRKLSPAERAERFDALLQHVEARIGAQPAVKDALQIRKTAWSRLIELATTKEQLEGVVALMPKWREMGRDFLPSTTLALQSMFCFPV
jgi:hypothetical protein